MTVEERVADFLRRNKGKDFCDDCIGARVQINRHQARNATSGLGATTNFHRAQGRCSHCGKIKKVIHAN